MKPRVLLGGVSPAGRPEGKDCPDREPRTSRQSAGFPNLSRPTALGCSRGRRDNAEKDPLDENPSQAPLRG